MDQNNKYTYTYIYISVGRQSDFRWTRAISLLLRCGVLSHILRCNTIIYQRRTLQYLRVSYVYVPLKRV